MRTHPFRDGNNRTLVNCFLLSQCVFFGISVFILREPNIFEFHTVEELAKKIKAARETAQNFKENYPDGKIFGFTQSSLKLDTETRKIYDPILEFSKTFRKEIKQIITAELQSTSRYTVFPSHGNRGSQSDKSAEKMNLCWRF